MRFGLRRQAISLFFLFGGGGGIEVGHNTNDDGDVILFCPQKTTLIYISTNNYLKPSIFVCIY